MSPCLPIGVKDGEVLWRARCSKAIRTRHDKTSRADCQAHRSGTGWHLPQQGTRGIVLKPPCIERKNLIFPAGRDVSNRAVVREDKPNRFTAPWHKRQHRMRWVFLGAGNVDDLYPAGAFRFATCSARSKESRCYLAGCN